MSRKVKEPAWVKELEAEGNLEEIELGTVDGWWVPAEDNPILGVKTGFVPASDQNRSGFYVFHLLEPTTGKNAKKEIVQLNKGQLCGVNKTTMLTGLERLGDGEGVFIRYLGKRGRMHEFSAHAIREKA
jgi:hypothetical protein